MCPTHVKLVPADRCPVGRVLDRPTNPYCGIAIERTGRQPKNRTVLPHRVVLRCLNRHAVCVFGLRPGRAPDRRQYEQRHHRQHQRPGAPGTGKPPHAPDVTRVQQPHRPPFASRYPPERTLPGRRKVRRAQRSTDPVPATKPNDYEVSLRSLIGKRTPRGPTSTRAITRGGNIERSTNPRTLSATMITFPHMPQVVRDWRTMTVTLRTQRREHRCALVPMCGRWPAIGQPRRRARRWRYRCSTWFWVRADASRYCSAAPVVSPVISSRCARTARSRCRVSGSSSR